MESSTELRDALQKTEPSSVTIPAPLVNRSVEMAAAMAHPYVQWLVWWLKQRAPGMPGPAPDLDLPIAALFEMACLNKRPDIKTSADFTAVPLKSWVHGYPTGPTTPQGIGASLRKMLNAKAPDAAVHVNVALVRELAALPSARGSKPRHPKIGVNLVVDATKIPAAITQERPISPTMARLVRNGLHMVGWVVYRRRSGAYYGACHGYKLVVMSCMDSTLPLVWTLVPADGTEWEAALRLLADLYRAWPDCPALTLTGDGAYLNKRFCRALLFRYGLHPIFPAPASGFGGKWRFAADLGVPRCCSGKHLMQLETVDGFMTPVKRANAGLAPGELGPTTGRLKWVCPDRVCVAGKLQRANTYLVDNPRIYTAFPHAGESNAAWMRRAMLLRRNGIESVFASLKHCGIGRNAEQRPYWADDYEHWWLLSIGLLMLTARRVAHETGLYEQCLAEAERLDLTRKATTEHPFIGPLADVLARETEARRFWAGKPKAPESWPAGGFWEEYHWLLAINDVRRQDELARIARVA